ncbi:hypothetical protein OUZ56_009686 [Daphnia magna]|uniref:Uncharacterized protein n=1 Tax=Daphnia magna TaxID=35525 RepID=A0ABR0AGQ1_9CRUS|nr:hypothetical protein OUZ56_009686 [Daphnia magna]
MASSNEEKICVIHIVDTAGSEKIKLFDDEKLMKCRNAQLVNRFRTNSKFSGVKIPESPNDIYGYHSSRYIKFTAVSGKQIKLAHENKVQLEILPHASQRTKKEGKN